MTPKHFTPSLMIKRLAVFRASKAIVARQDRRKREAYTQIANLTLDFLRRDTGTQDDFVDPKLLEFSFGDDAVFVDGKSNFAASSLVVLKNSFHVAMMIASLNDNKFALPRFMMFDNIEDKECDRTGVTIFN